NGIDFERISASPTGTQESDLIYFGRLKDHKNLDVLIQAIQLVKQHRPVRLTLIGSGPDEQRLRRLAATLDLAHEISFLGTIDDDREVMAAVKASKIFVHPSTKEGGSTIT